MRLLIEFTLSLLPFKVSDFCRVFRVFLVLFWFPLLCIFNTKKSGMFSTSSSLNQFSLQSVNIETPQGFTYTGKRMDTQRLCGVSVLRAGETMEPALCEVCKDIRLGKILIQTNLDTGEPEVFTLLCKLCSYYCAVMLFV